MIPFTKEEMLAYEEIQAILEIAELRAENEWLKSNDRRPDDIEYNSMRIFKLQARREKINDLIVHDRVTGDHE